MYELKYSSRFKKDLKKIRRQDDVLKGLEEALDFLAAGEKLTGKYRLHKLSGEFKNCYECHIRPDVLLIYKANKKSLLILLLRVGSHSELF